MCLDPSGINFIRNNVARLQPDILILEVGTNDITSGTPPQVVFNRISSLCHELVERSTVKYIVLIQIINRRRTRRCPISEFETRRQQYNHLIQQFARNYRFVYVFKHDRAVIVRLDPSISTDDIHITSRQGMRLYHFSLRRALIIAQTRCRNLV